MAIEVHGFQVALGKGVAAQVLVEFTDEITIALAGQPNCGKSTLFNQIAGYRARTANFPGTSVTFTETRTRIDGLTCTCIDLPGTYSLTSEEPAEREARKHLLSGEVDLIINVVDASLLSRSLELTLELLELEVPMLICLNMMDEAEKKGVQIDLAKLEGILGIPVVPIIATTGKGLGELFAEVHRVWKSKRKGRVQKFSKDIEEVIQPLVSLLEPERLVNERAPTRFLAVKLLEKDESFVEEIRQKGNFYGRVIPFQERLQDLHGVPSDEVISSERHALAMNIFEKAARIVRARMHPGGPRIVVVTSLLRQGAPENTIETLAVAEEGAWLVRTPRIPLEPPRNGTGDAIAALFLGRYLQTHQVTQSLEHAVSAMYNLLLLTHQMNTREIQLIAAQDEYINPSRRFAAEQVA